MLGEGCQDVFSGITIFGRRWFLHKGTGAFWDFEREHGVRECFGIKEGVYSGFGIAKK